MTKYQKLYEKIQILLVKLVKEENKKPLCYREIKKEGKWHRMILKGWPTISRLLN